MSLSVCSRLLTTREFLIGGWLVCHQPVVLEQFLFGEQPVLELVAILPTTHFVEVVGEPPYLRRGWAFAAGVSGQRSFAREARNEIRCSHCRFSRYIDRVRRRVVTGQPASSSVHQFVGSGDDVRRKEMFET